MSFWDRWLKGDIPQPPDKVLLKHRSQFPRYDTGEYNEWRKSPFVEPHNVPAALHLLADELEKLRIEVEKLKQKK